jgi:GxxExxY protein
MLRFSGAAVGLIEHPACLCHELELRGISYRSQVVLPLEYKGVQIAKGYVIDLLIEDSLVVEIKAVDKLLPIHSCQLMTYMRLQKVSCGLLLNFNVGILPQGIRRNTALTLPSVCSVFPW